MKKFQQYLQEQKRPTKKHWEVPDWERERIAEIEANPSTLWPGGWAVFWDHVFSKKVQLAAVKNSPTIIDRVQGAHPEVKALAKKLIAEKVAKVQKNPRLLADDPDLLDYINHQKIYRKKK